MARQGVQEQAARHNDPAAPYGELIVCLGLGAAVSVWFQRDVMLKERSSSLNCERCCRSSSHPQRRINCHARVPLQYLNTVRGVGDLVITAPADQLPRQLS